MSLLLAAAGRAGECGIAGGNVEYGCKFSQDFSPFEASISLKALAFF